MTQAYQKCHLGSTQIVHNAARAIGPKSRREAQPSPGSRGPTWRKPRGRRRRLRRRLHSRRGSSSGRLRSLSGVSKPSPNSLLEGMSVGVSAGGSPHDRGHDHDPRATGLPVRRRGAMQVRDRAAITGCNYLFRMCVFLDFVSPSTSTPRWGCIVRAGERTKPN